MMLSLLLAALLVQDGTTDAAAPADGAAREGSAVSAEGLRTRVHDMRMNLLLGGEQVRRAEAEAVDFYSGKLDLVDRRLDEVESELSHKRASYDLKLDQALSAREPARRESVMREATRLRADVTRLEEEATSLREKRQGLSKLVGAVQARDRERSSLVAQLETAGDLETGFGLPFTSIGLAPTNAAAEASASPYDDPALVSDLMERDPRAARRLLFETDPERYWQRFPLRPPSEALRASLDFPLPDLPGER